jgi:hypothetical protein
MTSPTELLKHERLHERVESEIAFGKSVQQGVSAAGLRNGAAKMI